MTRRIALSIWALSLLFSSATAQTRQVDLPSHLTIGRHTFFDFGPPNDFYEIIDVMQSADGLTVQRALVTPPGIACVQPATLEFSSGVLRESMQQLLRSKNPCAIPERELTRERKRCKKCLVFSGVDVTMQVSCSGKNREIRTDILDRDLFESKPDTPKNTSWSMAMLQELDTVLGPSVMDKPVFPVETDHPNDSAKGNLADEISDGHFDQLFGPQVKVSAIVAEAAKGPPPAPTIQIEEVSPVAPNTPEIPKYPPLAKIAHVEGLVEATFDIGADGIVRNVAFTSEPRLRMLEPAVSQSLSKWKFPESADGKSGKAAVRFQLNCPNRP